MADAGPPAAIAAPMRCGSSTIVRALTVADAAFDRRIFGEDRNAQFTPLGLDATVLATLVDQQFHAQQVGTRHDFPGAEHCVIEHAGQAVGRLTTSLVEGDSRALHVIAIVLSASARGRGIGTEVLNGVGEAALAQGATRLTLSVLRDNAAARRLYARLGFHPVVGDDASAYMAMVKPLPSADANFTNGKPV